MAGKIVQLTNILTDSGKTYSQSIIVNVDCFYITQSVRLSDLTLHIRNLNNKISRVLVFFGNDGVLAAKADDSNTELSLTVTYYKDTRFLNNISYESHRSYIRTDFSILPPTTLAKALYGERKNGTNS